MAKKATKTDAKTQAMRDLVESHAAWLAWAQKVGARNAPDLAHSKVVQAAAEKAVK